MIQRHVHEMKDHLEQNNEVRGWDPLFREIFAHSDDISMNVTYIDGGVIVEEISKSCDEKLAGKSGSSYHFEENEDQNCVVEMIHKHAHVVSKFIKKGMKEAMKEHKAPKCY